MPDSSRLQGSHLAPLLEELARAEAEAHAQRESRRRAYHEAQARLQREVPARFQALARKLRDGVDGFNASSRTGRPISYRDAGVGLRDAPVGGALVEIRRDPSWIRVGLRQMARSSGPDAWIIEGQGAVGFPPEQTEITLRIDAVVGRDDVRWRILAGGGPLASSLDQLPERLVAVVATGDLAHLA